MVTVADNPPAEGRGAYRLGLIYVSLATLAWSLGGLFAKLVAVDSFTTLYWRGIFGAVSLFVVLMAFERRKGLDDLANLGVGGWLYALTSASGMACYLSSIYYTSIAQNSIIWALVPLMTALAGWLLLRERVGVSTVIASLIAFAGVLVMLIGGAGEGSALGNSLAFLMMLSGVAMILVSRKFRGIPMMAASLVASLLSAVLALPFARPADATTLDLLVLLTFGITQGAIGMVLFGLGARLIPSAESALISALEGPLGPLWVLLALGIMPLPATILGGAIVLAAVIGHIVIENRRAAPSSSGTIVNEPRQPRRPAADGGGSGTDGVPGTGGVPRGPRARAGFAPDRQSRPTGGGDRS